MSTKFPGYDDLVALALGDVSENDRIAFQNAVAGDPAVADQLAGIATTLSLIRPARIRFEETFNRRLKDRWLGEIAQNAASPVIRLEYPAATPRIPWIHRPYRLFAIGTAAALLAIASALWLPWFKLRRQYSPAPIAYAPLPSPQPAQQGVTRTTMPMAPTSGTPLPIGSWPMFGLTPNRNALSPEKNPPTFWDVNTGQNILWSATLGSKGYGNPIVTQGIVTIGTNNENHRDPSNPADGGVEMAFDQLTGKFLWQKHYSKLPTGRINDWPGEGLCATAYSEPGRLWYCTNQCHVVCLDLSLGAPKLPDGSPPVIWDYDMIAYLGVFPHNMTASSIAAYGDLIYVITGNGVDDTHKYVVAPKAPDIVCFNKNTGNVVWTDNSPGENILHGQWSSVAIAEVNGRAIVIAPLGDAWVYAYDALTGKLVWKFDCNPKDVVYPQTRNEVIAMPCIAGDYMYIANGQDPEHAEGFGHMYCVDITGHGDVSLELDADPNAGKPKPGEYELLGPDGRPLLSRGKPNPNSRVVWHYDVAHHPGKIARGEHMNRTISTAVVTREGLCFVPDYSGFLHCFDAKTGEQYWYYDMESAMWGSPLYADGKIYLTDEDGTVRIFKNLSKNAPKKSDVVSIEMGSNIYSSPVLVNGVLYIMTRNRLVAIKEGVQGQPVQPNE